MTRTEAIEVAANNLSGGDSLPENSDLPATFRSSRVAEF